ncbi:MAG: flagellar motor protein MotB, partial [Clostridium sp.]
MGKKRQHHNEHVDEAWLLPYADMLTLLLALFIVMFAMSQVDKEKLQKTAQQFNVVFAGGSGVLDNNGTTITPGNGSMNEIVEQDKMILVKSILEEEIKNSGYVDKVNVELNGEGLLISMQDTVLFNSGDAEILKGFYPVFNQISSIIKDFNNDIRVAGHTDNIPINNSKFHSNWDLSYSRSLNVMKFMASSGHISPDKFSIQAFAQYKPKFDNSTNEGQSKNRRVEILIVR